MPEDDDPEARELALALLLDGYVAAYGSFMSFLQRRRRQYALALLGPAAAAAASAMEPGAAGQLGLPALTRPQLREAVADVDLRAFQALLRTAEETRRRGGWRPVG